MNILVVSHYFPPEIGAPQARLSELARFWTEAGEDVTVLTGMPNHPTGVVPPEYRGKLRLQETVDGYRVVRTWVYATPNEKVARKTLSHLSFMASSVALGLSRTGPVDVVVVSSPTFFSILAGWAIARLKGARLVVEIRDLWPALVVELGVLTSRPLIRALEAIEMASYRAADAVVLVTEGFRRNLADRGIDPTKLHTIPNGADIDRFAPLALTDGERNEIRARLGAGAGETLVLYIGAHGICHGLTAVAEAAGKLTGEPVHFSFVGEGATKAELAQRVAQLGLDNVTLQPGVPREEVPRLLAASDICLVPLRNVDIFSSFIPSKTFEYLAAEKAVVGSVRGEPGDVLRASGAVVVEPEDVSGLADAIRDLASDPRRRDAMGKQGRQYVLEHFDRRKLAERYRSLLRQVTGAE